MIDNRTNKKIFWDRCVPTLDPHCDYVSEIPLDDVEDGLRTKCEICEKGWALNGDGVC